MNDDRPFGRKALALVAPACVWALAGCAIDSIGSDRNSEIGWRDASATMRVEVEVYKGPLSKDPAVQVAELRGIVDDSARAMEILLYNMDYSRRQMKCYVPDACTEEVAKRVKNCKKMPNCDANMEKEKADSSCRTRTIEERIRIVIGGCDTKSFPFMFTFTPGDAKSRNETQACNSLRQLFRDIDEGMKKYRAVKDALP